MLTLEKRKSQINKLSSQFKKLVKEQNKPKVSRRIEITERAGKMKLKTEKNNKTKMIL